jgi:hypothetical protein
VYYQPESEVIHFGDGVECYDAFGDHGRLLRVNHMKFISKWKAALQCQPARPDEFTVGTWHRLATRDRDT